MSNDIENEIRENASGPKQASVDGVTVHQHSLPDQIAADRYLASKDAMKKKGLGAILRKLVPPGAD